MNAIELVSAIEASGGIVHAEGGLLKATLPEQARPLVEQIRERKQEILDLLTRRTTLPRPPIHDPTAWAEDFHRWALERCAYRDRCFGGIGILHTDFCRWTLQHESVPIQRVTFEELLRHQGFLFADGLVSGLVLKEDLRVRREMKERAAAACKRPAADACSTRQGNPRRVYR